MRKDFIDAFEYEIIMHKIFLKEKNDMLKCKICGCEFHAVNENIIFPVIIRKLVCQQLLAASWKLLYMILMIALLVAVR